MTDQKELQNQCGRITKHMQRLIALVGELENTPDDEAAYSIMYSISVIAEAMSKASAAGENDCGEAHEAVANAIRSAK